MSASITAVLTAHGSADPRAAANVRSVAGHLRRLAPEWDVQVAFCEHNTPALTDVLTDVNDGRRIVVVPFLLASAYHARTDIPALIAAAEAPAIQASALGEDDRLVAVLGHRLAELGVSRFDADCGVVVTAVGSSHPEANRRTASVAGRLADRTRWAGVEVAFATGPSPTIGEAINRLRNRGATRLAVAPWFLAPGRILSGITEYAGQQRIPVAEPLGAHRLVAATVYERVEAALVDAQAA